LQEIAVAPFYLTHPLADMLNKQKITHNNCRILSGIYLVRYFCHQSKVWV